MPPENSCGQQSKSHCVLRETTVSFCSSKNNVLWKHWVFSFDRNKIGHAISDITMKTWSLLREHHLAPEGFVDDSITPFFITGVTWVVQTSASLTNFWITLWNMICLSTLTKKNLKLPTCILVYSFAEYYKSFQIMFAFPAWRYAFLCYNRNCSYPSRIVGFLNLYHVIGPCPSV